MSASLMYSPVAKGKSFGGGSSLVEMLREYKGGGELGVFDTSDISALRGMAIAADKDSRKSINELITAIETHDHVNVWAEY